MKKFVLAVMAVAAIGFTASCGNKTQQAEVAVDSTAIVDSLASAAAQTDIDAISALFNGGDATKLQEDTDKVKAVVGDNVAAATALSAITETSPADIVSGLLTAVGDAAEETKDAAVDAANQKVEEGKQAVQDKANEINDAAKQKVQETKDAAKQKANEAIDNAANDVKKGLGL